MSASDPILSPKPQIRAAGICPALGAFSDPETRFAYPSTGNFCHRVEPARGVTLAHQEACCLYGAFETCPVYLGETQGVLPDKFRRGSPDLEQPIYQRWWVWVIAVILIVGGILGGWLLLGNAPEDQQVVVGSGSETPVMLSADTVPQTDTPVPATLTATWLPTQTSTPSPAPTEILLETPQPSPTNTLPPTPGPGLGTPFGDEVTYVLHRVQEGQGFGVLSNLYNTNEEVIRAANVLREGRTIWPGDILIIPVGQTDPTQVNAFRYLFIEKKTALSELARQYAVTLDDIRRYNLLGPDEWVPAGRWLIIPAVGE